jgi:hypothetical protein
MNNMKKTFTILLMSALGFFASGQAPVRMSLYEEFTGENCGPCAQTNPGLNSLLASQASKIIPIKWQVPIPSAPTNTWSLYQTDQAEIDWRWQAGGYNYQSQNTPTTSPSAGINSAPQGRIDGQHQWVFGATQDHPAVLTSAVIGSAQAVPTPFSINMNAVWNGSFTSAVVSVTVQAASSFTANGPLVFRLVLVERVINFSVAPGTNGEKDFYDAVRKSYPNIQTGTVLSSTWTAGQSQTFSINCVSPGYVVSPYQQAFVGFIQDDGNKMVWQAARTSKPAVPNDIQLNTVNVALNCMPNFTPGINVTNNGTTAITGLTMTPYVDGAAQTPVTWSGNLAGLSSTNIALNGYTAAVGSHNFSVNITNVSGGNVITNNNNNSAVFGVVGTFSNTSVTEGFPTLPFPPANWMIQNYAPTTGSITWVRNGTVGNGGVGSAQYDFYNNGFYGDIDDLILPPEDFSSVNNPVISFDWAYSSYPTGVGSGVYQDAMEVKVSTDCGQNWTTVFSKTGSALQTCPSTTAAFVPAAGQWSNTVIPLPTAANQSQVLVKFRAINDYGNLLYLDNVNLGQATSLRKYAESASSFDLYPNPASSSATVKIYTASEQKGRISVYNMLGQIVKSADLNLSHGINETQIDLSQIPAGVYNVIVQTGNSTLIKKLSVAK